jgi:hypothetical protein
LLQLAFKVMIPRPATRQREDAMEGVSRYALAVPQCIQVFKTFHACLGHCPEKLGFHQTAKDSLSSEQPISEPGVE